MESGREEGKKRDDDQQAEHRGELEVDAVHGGMIARGFRSGELGIAN